MRKILVTHAFSGTRDDLIELSIDRMRYGNGFLYILPSRESIFEVREKILENNNGIINSDIVTFYDLEKKAIKTIKGEVNTIEEVEAKLVLSKALEELKLDYFHKIADKKGFINQIYSIIKSLKRNNLKPEDESSFIDSIADIVLKRKFGDIFKIYGSYEAIKGNHFDIDDISLEAANFTNSDFINSKDIIIIDGYINIDPVDLVFIDSILENYNGDVIISIPFTNQMVYNFVRDQIILPFEKRGFNTEINMDCTALNSIEELALKFGTLDRVIFPADTQIAFNNSPCVEDEVRRCGRFIKEKLIKTNCSINDIAICVNGDYYTPTILEVFEEYGIPLRIPSIVNLNETGLFKEVLTLVRLSDVRDSEMEQVLKSSFFSRCTNAYEILLNYNFDRKSYQEPGEEEKEFFSKGEVEYSFEFYEQITHLIEKKKEMDIIDYIKYALEYLKVEENILSLSIDNIKAYLAIILLIDNIKNIKDKWNIKTSETLFHEVLIDGASTVGVTLRKSRSYGVNLLNTDHFKGNKYKLVCALGLNEGMIPAKNMGNSILSLSEREYLGSHISLISPSFELKREKIRFNIMLSSAESFLYLSYLTSRDTGEYMIKSPYLSEIERLFGLESEESKRTMRDRFNLGRDEISSINEALFYCNEQKLDDFDLQHFKSEQYNPIRNIKDIGRLDTSPRKIENYAMCPFKFLVEDILMLRDFNSGDFTDGNICHNVLREYYKKFDGKTEFSEEGYSRIFNEVIRKFNLDISELMNRIFADELKEILRSFICADYEIFDKFREAKKDIEIMFLEKSFRKMEISGRVDRVDLIVEEGTYTGEYIIHDYKFSGSHTDIKKISGLEKLQLAVYRWMIDDEVSAITGKKAKCIALLYRPLKTAVNGERTLHGVILKEYGKLFGFKGNAHFVIEENLGVLYDHLDESIQEIRLLLKTGKLNTISNCNFKDDYMLPCAVGKLCREGI